MNVMLAIMVASLCGRMFTLRGEPAVPIERTTPSWRFLKLFTSERWDRYGGAPIEELWSRIDAKSRDLWGFTIEEELQQDWEIESQLLRNFEERQADSPVTRAFRKYHATRKVLIDDFIASPNTYTSTEVLGSSVLRRIASSGDLLSLRSTMRRTDLRPIWLRFFTFK
jgi:hypothetical protein